MRHHAWFLAATVFAAACGGSSDPDMSNGKPDMTTTTDPGDMPIGQTGDLGDAGPGPDMADNKPILTLTKVEAAPGAGPCKDSVVKGKGTVTSDVGGINCGSTCVGNYSKGQMVTLTAVPESTTTAFTGWTGDVPQSCLGDLNNPAPLTCTLPINGTTNVTATFTRSYWASVQLSDPSNYGGLVTVWQGANMTNKLTEVQPNSSVCLNQAKDATFYVGVQVPQGHTLFGSSECILPKTCMQTVTAGGALVFYRIM